MKRLLLATALLSTPALAKEVTVSDQEQKALQTICDVASVSTSVTREVRAQIANFCVAWEKKIADPIDANANPVKPEEQKK